jgi:hypothetical protein
MGSRQFAFALMAATAVSASCTRGESGNPTVEIEGQPVALLEYVATSPADWQGRQPASQMRLAEFVTPAAAGADAGAEVVVYFFGAGQGGSVEANIERWKSQFADSEGNHPEPVTARDSASHFPATFVQLRGSYTRSIGMGDTAVVAKPDQVLMAAVVETPRGNLHVQMHGPAASVLAQEAAFRGFVRGIRPHAPTT